jgi:hypothetical protein
MKTVIETVGPYAGLVSMIGLFVAIGLLFS